MAPLLELYFTPAMTLRQVDSETVPQYVAALGIPVGESGDSFQQLCKVAWLAALQCHLAPPALTRATVLTPDQLGKRFPSVPDDEIRINGTSVNNSSGLRERLLLPKTLARTSTGRGLDYPQIVRLLSQNFNVVLSGFAEADEQSKDFVFFPMIPGLQLTAAEQSLLIDFHQHQPRSSEFEDQFDEVLESLLVRFEDAPGVTHPAKDRSELSYATLLFEQYFDRLVSLVNDAYHDAFVASGQESLTLGELLDGDFEVEEAQKIDFERIGAMLTNDFLSGLRIPDQFADLATTSATFEGHYVWSGQQFSITEFDPDDPVGAYEVALGRSATLPASWVNFGTVPPTTETINGQQMQQFMSNSVPTQIRSAAPINPIEKNPRRFAFTEAYQWDVAETHPAILKFSSGLQQELKRIRDNLKDSDATDVDQRIRLRLFADVASQNNQAGADPPDQELTDLRWITLIPMLIRQVVDTTAERTSGEDPPSPVKNLYELVGMSEDNRRRLTELLGNFQSDQAEVFVLYPTGAGESKNGFASDSLSSNVDANQCILLRTNLSTETAPSSVTFREAGAALLAREVADPDVASIGQERGFLRLVENACLVNGGGYYLYYEPSPGDDPLSELFEVLNTDQVQLQILVRFKKTSEDPAVRPYYNGVSGPIPDAPSGDATQYVYARLDRAKAAGPLEFHPVNEFDTRMPPGSVGFRVTRDRIATPTDSVGLDLSNEEVRHYLDNLFSRLAYQVTTPDTEEYRKFPLTLPLRAIDPNANSSDVQASGASTTEPWTWDGVLQVLTQPFTTPYAGIGGPPIHVSFGFCDVYGNQFPAATGSPSSIDLSLRYFDKLIHPRQWPGLRSRFDIEDGQFVVRLECNPYDVEVVDNQAEHRLTLEQRVEIWKRYQQIKLQLNDRRLQSQIELSLKGMTGDPAKILNECKGELVEFVDQVPLPDAPATPLPDVVIKLGKPDLSFPADFYSLDVTLVVFRNGDDSLFAKIKEPWDAAPYAFPSARKVQVPISLPGDEVKSNDQSMLAFATKFEALFASQGFHFALGVRDDGTPQSWILDKKRLVPELRQVSRTEEQTDLVFAPRPLTTKLEGRELNGIPAAMPLPGASDGDPLDKKFTEVEIDAESRRYLGTVESFLAPPTVRSILTVEDTTAGNKKFGRDSLQRIIDAKREISNGLPEQLIVGLYQNAPDPQTCAQTSARNAFRQRVLSTLNAIYGLDVILQFDAIPPVAMQSHREQGGIAWFGKIAEKQRSSVTLNYQNSKIRFQSPFEEQPPRLTVLIDQPSSDRRPPESRSLTFQFTHLEYDIKKGSTPCGVEASFQDSRWLTLINPISIDVAGGNQVDIPIPLRVYPDTPRLTSHAAELSLDRQDSDLTPTLQNARFWDYQLVYEARMEQQDTMRLTVDLNVAPSTLRAMAVSRDLLTELLLFHTSFPNPNQYFKALRTAGIDPAYRPKFLKRFVERTSAVAETLATMALAPSSAAVSRVGDRRLEYEIDDFTPGVPNSPDNRLARIRWKDIDELATLIGPFPSTDAEVTLEPHSTTARFLEPDPVETDGYRGRLVEVQGIDVLRFESSKPRSHMLRNLVLVPPSATPGDPKYAVRSDFVYKTGEVTLADPLIPHLLVTDPIPLSDPPTVRSLTEHLEKLFTSFFANTPDVIRPERLARLEMRYAFDASGRVDLGSSNPQPILEIPVSSAQRLLPPTEIKLDPDQRRDLIHMLVTELASWNDTHAPAQDGRLVFDLLLYASIVPADINRPLLHIKNIELPLSLIRSWE
ncbi:hypothetical protein Pan97_06910 [Bremerella volcania]|uniref:Uncharacterized protein n=1 Tax=Bremerella volcania TaxID=2527984 RepID=A0A518C3A2_9BACT|nr:hypothetical protein [Bremerella volcania]QDU73693.1 hypothetical protein Pan97_06910 [Bremerella volcania]